jgi:hypothetical protein
MHMRRVDLLTIHVGLGVFQLHVGLEVAHELQQKFHMNYN